MMYCTGGVRCERAGALLREKIEKDPTVADLNIQGVYQLQGGIDKYFKEYPDGGNWVGKNYTFDKRFSHVPEGIAKSESEVEVLSKCEACEKPWDRFRGKRRCPTCGVPSIICSDCFDANEKSLASAQCALCKEEGVKNKNEVKQKEKRELEEYEKKQKELAISNNSNSNSNSNNNSNNNGKKDKDSRTYDRKAVREVQPAPNPDQITRVWIGNLNKQSVSEQALIEVVPKIKFLQWVNSFDGTFKGCCFAEMLTPEDASYAVGVGEAKRFCLGRPVYVNYAKADGKSLWPPRDKIDIEG